MLSLVSADDLAKIGEMYLVELLYQCQDSRNPWTPQAIYTAVGFCLVDDDPGSVECR